MKKHANQSWSTEAVALLHLSVETEVKRRIAAALTYAHHEELAGGEDPKESTPLRLADWRVVA